MRKSIGSFLSLAVVVSISVFNTGCERAEENYTVPEELALMYEKYIDSIDVDWGNELAVELSTNSDFFSTENLGGRNAGSGAEHKTAEYLLGIMEDIGLSDVEKTGVKCDLFDTRGAYLTVDGKEYPVYSYETRGTDKGGINAEIVYLGTGTAAEYEGIDVKGKIVLVDVNQRDNWWVTYPMLEAEHQGAAAVLAAQSGGFSEIADDALNANDICAPLSIPTVSIGAADSRELQEKIKAGKTEGNLTVNNITGENKGTTYNLTGRIKGKDSSHQILFGGHYDCHYFGFQDDNCAVALVLTIAKAMVDSGYMPENDIVFCLHGAEEWGSYNTAYDWATGAWEMINRINPEWVGKTLAFINFELPAYKFQEYAYSNSAPAFYSMIDFYTNVYPLSGDSSIFTEGIKTNGYQTYTYADDFSYYLAGIPCINNGFLHQEDQITVNDFYLKYYHTNYDTPDLWDGDVFRRNAQYYGSMSMYIDQMPALYLDFTGDFDRITNAFDKELLGEYDVDIAAYGENLKEVGEAATANASKVKEINDAYVNAWIDKDTDAMDSLKAEGRKLTDRNLETFRFISENFLSVMYSTPVVPHEASQINIKYMNQILECLDKGDINTAVDEYVWQVNATVEYLVWFFSPEVMEIVESNLWNDKHNMFWGNDTTFVKADVAEASKSLYYKYDTEEETAIEQRIYGKAIKAQAKVMAEYANEEIKNLKKLTALLAL